jgi:translation initiation factor 1 (eIF-1/SUI1)
MSEVGYKKPPIEHRFQKGVKPPGAGRPKGYLSLLNLLRKKIEECPDGQDKKTYADLIIDRMMADSIKKGDIQHIKTIWAYLEGMPKQQVDLSSLGEKIGTFDIDKLATELKKKFAESGEMPDR